MLHRPLSARPLGTVVGGRVVLGGMGSGWQATTDGQTNWHWYLQFSKTVQSSESIDRYGSNLIVLQAPVKMIIKRKT